MAAQVEIEVAQRILDRGQMTHLSGDVEDHLGAVECVGHLRRVDSRLEHVVTSRPATLARSPPCWGTIASMTVTSAPRPTSSCTRFDPMKPSPPVTMQREPASGEREATRAAYERALYGGAHRAPPTPTDPGHGNQESATTAWAKYPRPIAEQARAPQITQLGARRDKRVGDGDLHREGEHRVTGEPDDAERHRRRHRQHGDREPLRGLMRDAAHVEHERDERTMRRGTARGGLSTGRPAHSTIDVSSHADLADQNTNGSPVAQSRYQHHPIRNTAEGATAASSGTPRSVGAGDHDDHGDDGDPAVGTAGRGHRGGDTRRHPARLGRRTPTPTPGRRGRTHRSTRARG